MKKFSKKSFAFLLALVMLLTTINVGIFGITASAASVTVSNTDNAVIAVPETVYMAPSTDASALGQYYVNNIVTSGSYSVELEASAANTNAYVQFYIPGAKDVSIAVNTVAGGIGDVVLAESGSLSGSYENTSLASLIDANGYFSYKTAGLYIAGTALTAGNSALAEWVFTITMSDGSVRKYYAYTTLYAPYYQPVGAAAWAQSSSTRQSTAGSILWVSGVHGYSTSNYSGAAAYYPRTGGLLPMFGTIATGNNKRPSDNWIQASSNGLSPTVTYFEDSGSYHRRVNVVSPVANLTVDSSRYSNFNQIPNFKVGFIITSSENSDEGSWYVADYTGYTADMSNSSGGSGTKSDVGSSIYDKAKGTTVASGSDKNCELKYNGSWNRAIATGTVQLKSALRTENNDYLIKKSAWNYNFIQMNVTGADKASLRSLVLQGTSLNANNYTSATWSAYQTQLRDAAAKLGNPTNSSVDTSALTTARNALQTTVTLNANGGSIGTTSFVATCGAASTFSVDVSSYVPTRTGYTFKGWATSSTATSGSKTTVSAGLMPTLYAVWEANSYNVVFDNLVDFSAWNTSSASNATISNVTSGGFTLTSNEGAGEGTSSSPYFPVEPGKQYRVDIDFTGDAWDVYIFFCDANGNWVDFADGPSNRYSSNGSTGIDKDNAVFTAPSDASVVKAQIRVDANGSSNSVTFDNIRVYEVDTVSADVSYTTSKSVTYDSTYGTLPTPTREHYVFLGWYKADGTKLNETDTVDITDNLYVTSKWELAKYTITWVYANGKETTDTLEYGAAITAPKNTTKYPDGNNHYAYTWSPAVAETVTGNATYTEVLSTEAHTVGDVEIIANPTCTTDGWHVQKCTVCGHLLVNEAIPATGHKEVIEAAVEATCTTDGLTEGKHCSVCGEIIAVQETVPALGHKEVTTTVDATCETAGSVTVSCSVCGEIFSTKEISATGHSFGDWEVTKYPTFDAEGVKTKACANCDAEETEALLPVKLKTTRIISSEIAGNNITLVSYTNADTIAFNRSTVAGEAIEFDNWYDEEDKANEPTPIKKGDESERWIVYHARWEQYAENGKYVTPVTIGGIEYNLTIIFNDRPLEANDFVLNEKYTGISVDNENKVVTFTATKGTESITFKETSRQYDEFTYTMTADENVVHNAVSGNYRGSYTINSNGAYELEKTITLNKGKYCQTDYTLRIVFVDIDVESALKPLRGTVTLETSEDGVGYLRLAMADGKTSVGIYKDAIGDEIVSVSVDVTSGNVIEKDDLYVAYKVSNNFNPTGVATITFANGTVATYDVVFDMGLGEEVIEPADPLDELRLIRSTASFDEDGTLRITRNSGLLDYAGAGFYALTTAGETVTFEVTEGTIYSGRTDAFVAYLSQNTTNVSGVLSFTLSDGTEVKYNAVLDLGL